MSGKVTIRAIGGLRMPAAVLGTRKDVALAHGEELDVPAAYGRHLAHDGFAVIVEAESEEESPPAPPPAPLPSPVPALAPAVVNAAKKNGRGGSR